MKLAVKLVKSKKYLKSIYVLLILSVICQTLPAQNLHIVYEFSSYPGSETYEDGSHLAVNNSGDIFIAGNTSSQTFPYTENAYCIIYKGGDDLGYGGDVFLTKINESGDILEYSTFFGGTNMENHTYYSVADEEGNISIEDASYQIVSSTGKIVQQGKLISKSIDISGLPKGIFMLSLHIDKGIISKKIVIG